MAEGGDGGRWRRNVAAAEEGCGVRWRVWQRTAVAEDGGREGAAAEGVCVKSDVITYKNSVTLRTLLRIYSVISI